MSQEKKKNENEIHNKVSNKKLTIFRNNYNIYNSRSFKNVKEDNNNNITNSFHSIEPILFDKNINIQNNNIINGIFNRNNNNYIFNKRKKDYNKFNPNPYTEEIPTFSFENELNVNSYKQQINKNNQNIEKNYSNYLNYIEKFENKNRKKSLISPYSLYIKKLKDVKKYDDHTSLTSRGKETNELSLDINKYDNNKNNYNNIKNNILNDNLNTNDNNINNNYYIINNNNSNSIKNLFNQRINKKIEKDTHVSKSLKNINYFGRKNEISNPELFFKRSDEDYYRYREEQRRFDDYNYNILLNKNKSRFIKKEPDINPFNPKIDLYKIGKSNLSHNTILKPEDFYGYYNKI